MFSGNLLQDRFQTISEVDFGPHLEAIFEAKIIKRAQDTPKMTENENK